MRESKLDWVTVLLYIFLVIIGWTNIYSTGMNDHAGFFDLSSHHGKQLLFIGVGMLGGGFILLMDTKFLEFISYAIYGATLLMLIVVFLLATATHGSLSWIEIGSFKLQPTEFAKVGTLMGLAKYMSRYNFSLDNRIDVLVCILMVFVPMGLVLGQNDPGSALVFLSMIFMFYREGMNPLILISFFILGIVAIAAIMLAKVPMAPYMISATIFALGLLLWFLLLRRKLALILFPILLVLMVIPFVINRVIKPHHSARLRVLVTTEDQLKALKVQYQTIKSNDASTPEEIRAIEKEYVSMRQAYFQLRHSLIAIGSGSLTGKGFGKSTHTRGDYVPEEHTDYIYCVIGEEFGFAGSAGLLILFMILLYRIIYMAENSRTSYARVYGYGVFSVFVCHVLINTGMTIGLMPTVGIPLVFISYGGSSMISFSAMLFVLLNHYSYRHAFLR